MKTVLTIAGSDSSGGAGIQADLKTMTACGVYGMSAITALTAQNTTGVRAVLESTPEFLKEQLDAVFEDIVPDAVKIGMVSSAGLIRVIADRLRFYKPKHIVLDPVMVATSGSSLLENESLSALVSELFPLVTVITPNIPEAEVLTQQTITDQASMEQAARALGEQWQVSVLLKGGHAVQDANDLLWEQGTLTWLLGTRIDNPNTHGTGCTLSSAIAANLAKGYSLQEAVREAKNYVARALSAMLDLGAGSGPLWHGV